MRNQKRAQTQQNIDKQLDRMLFLAAEQRLLPKIIYEYSYQHNSPVFANKYRDSVKKIYTKETATPLKYDEEEAKTHREKFREKILKLVSNQLPIDYVKNTKLKNNKYIITYQGHPLEKVPEETKSQFKIFRQFNQNKFKTGFNDVFDDKLQYKYQQMFNPLKKQSFPRSKTKPNQQIQEPPIKKITKTAPTLATECSSKQSPHSHLQQKQPQPSIPVSLPKLVSRTQFNRSKLASPKPQNLKKKPKLPKNVNEQQLIGETMRKIGGYSGMVGSVSLTKESILKYFRDVYARPHRFADFLEVNEVESYTTYAKLPQKLKFMPNQHVLFMAFLYYDSNNDGYICSNDLLRLEEVAKRSPLLMEDYQILKTGAHRVKYQSKLKYMELYRLAEISQSTYFNWLQKQKEKGEENPQFEENQELKDYFENLNKRKIFIHYEGFKMLFHSHIGNQKPYLWYDLFYRLSGIKYQGLKYE